MEKSRKAVQLFSVIILVEICLFFLITHSPPVHYPILKNASTFSFIVLMALVALSLILLLFPLLFKQASAQFLKSFFTSKYSFSLFLSLITISWLSSGVFFLLADRFDVVVYQYLWPYALLFYILGYQILILLALVHKNYHKQQRYWLALPLLVAGNYFLRHTLEQAGMYLKPYFSLYLVEEAKIVFSSYKWWQLLLPIKEFTGIWNFNLVLTYWITECIGASGTWYLLQAILIVVSFFLSWKVFKSAIFSSFLALCLGFGTQLYHTYQVPGSIGYYLLYTMFIVLLYLAYQFIQSANDGRKWFLLLFLALIFTAILYEGWLDFFAAVWLVSIFLFIYYKKQNKKPIVKRIAMVFGLFNLVALVYIYIKFTYIGFIHTEGIESDVVFNYPYFWLMVEDVLSNYLTHMHIILTNFLPPPFITSNSLYYYSAAELIEQQFRYHEAMTHLVPYHYMFLWRYFAGALTVLFLLTLVKVFKGVLKDGKKDWLPLAIFMIITATNGPTHTIVKIRPMNTMPVLGYHTLVGILGFSLVISYVAHLYYQKTHDKKRSLVVLGIQVLIILNSSLARPKILWHMIEQVGLDVQGPYPNPIKPILFFLQKYLPGLF